MTNILSLPLLRRRFRSTYYKYSTTRISITWSSWSSWSTTWSSSSSSSWSNRPRSISSSDKKNYMCIRSVSKSTCMQ
jgi:hypothetical protein